jgi:hemolysin D
MKLKLPKKQDNLQYEFLPAALEVIETPPSPFGRIVLWMIVAILVSALTWSYFGKIDEVAVARGKVIPDGNVKIIEPANGGVINSVRVTEGEYVKQGQVLADLDSTLATVDVESAQKSLDTAKAERDILRKVSAGEDATDAINTSNLPDDTKSDLLQLASSTSSSDQVKRQFLSLDISQAQKQLATEQQNLSTLKANLSDAQNRQQQLRDTISQTTDAAALQSLNSELQTVTGEIASLQSSIVSQTQRTSSAQSSLNQAKASLGNYSAQNDLSTVNSIIDQDKKITDLESALAKAQKNIQLQTIKAPVDGTVLSISSTTVGSVITSTQPFVTIVPSGTPLVIEATLSNRDIGFVSVGQKVAIKVDAYSFQRYGYLSGRVKSISPDAFDDQKQGLIYKMKVTIDSNKTTTKNNEINVGAGMSVSAEVKTGKRRIINFFLDPFITKTNEALKVR